MLGQAVTVEKYAILAILLTGGGVFLYHRLRQPKEGAPLGREH